MITCFPSNPFLFPPQIERFYQDDVGGRQFANYGVLGIMNIASHLFLIIITERELVAQMPSGDYVYLISVVEMIPFDKHVNDINKLPLDVQKFAVGVK